MISYENQCCILSCRQFYKNCAFLSGCHIDSSGKQFEAATAIMLAAAGTHWPGLMLHRAGRSPILPGEAEPPKPRLCIPASLHSWGLRKTPRALAGLEVPVPTVWLLPTVSIYSNLGAMWGQAWALLQPGQACTHLGQC